MAQVTRGPRLRERIDAYLEYLMATWSDVPHLAAEWDDLDKDQQDDMVLDWEGVPADRLLCLRRWARDGLLTPEQYERYEQLIKRIAQLRPTLDRLFGEDAFLGLGPLPAGSPGKDIGE